MWLQVLNEKSLVQTGQFQFILCSMCGPSVSSTRKVIEMHVAAGFSFFYRERV